MSLESLAVVVAQRVVNRIHRDNIVCLNLFVIIMDESNIREVSKKFTVLISGQ